MRLSQSERILAILGMLIAGTAIVLSLTMDIVAQREVADIKRRIAVAGSTATPAQLASDTYHLGWSQKSLDARWSPAGHGTIGAGIALFGLALIGVAVQHARRRDTV